METLRKVHVKSFGCQMNVYDSQRMADTLAPAGFRETSCPQDADLVILIFREEMYKQTNEPAESDGTAELILAKQRNGPTGLVKLAFLRQQTRFANLAAEH